VGTHTFSGVTAAFIISWGLLLLVIESGLWRGWFTFSSLIETLWFSLKENWQRLVACVVMCAVLWDTGRPQRLLGITELEFPMVPILRFTSIVFSANCLDAVMGVCYRWFKNKIHDRKLKRRENAFSCVFRDDILKSTLRARSPQYGTLLDYARKHCDRDDHTGCYRHHCKYCWAAAMATIPDTKVLPAKFTQWVEEQQDQDFNHVCIATCEREIDPEECAYYLQCLLAVHSAYALQLSSVMEYVGTPEGGKKKSGKWYKRQQHATHMAKRASNLLMSSDYEKVQSAYQLDPDAGDEMLERILERMPDLAMYDDEDYDDWQELSAHTTLTADTAEERGTTSVVLRLRDNARRNRRAAFDRIRNACMKKAVRKEGFIEKHLERWQVYFGQFVELKEGPEKETVQYQKPDGPDPLQAVANITLESTPVDLEGWVAEQLQRNLDDWKERDVIQAKFAKIETFVPESPAPSCDVCGKPYGYSTKRKRFCECPVKEGCVAESSVVVADDLPTAFAKWEDQHTSHGYIRRAPQGVWFVTNRHDTRFTPNSAGYDHAAQVEIGAKVAIVMRKQVFTATLREKAADDRDRVQYLLMPEEGFDASKLPDVKFGKTPTVGSVVSMWAYDMRDNKWGVTFGAVKHVTSEGHFFYQCTTQPGFCRTPVYDQMGRVIGGHYHPGINTASGKAPGAEGENGVLVKGVAQMASRHRVISQGLTRALNSSVDWDLGKSPWPHRKAKQQKVYPPEEMSETVRSMIPPTYIYAEPSTDQVKAEVEKFGEQRPCGPFDKRLLAIANLATMAMERDAQSPPRRITFEHVNDIVRQVIQTDKSAGVYPGGHKQHVEDFTEKTGEEAVVTYVDYIWQAWKWFEQGNPELELENEKVADLIRQLKYWQVLGKLDGYKKTKLMQGRSVQAPTLAMKCFWNIAFQANDKDWASRNYHFRVGADQDQTIPKHLMEQYSRAIGCVAFDQTGWDRYMLAMLMRFFFRDYMPVMQPGVPPLLMEVLEDATINSMLIFADGTMCQKKRGNPSGFPNTLRLNCVTHLFVYNYIVASLLQTSDVIVPTVIDVLNFQREHIFLEICGDDSAVWLKTQEAKIALGADQDWDRLTRAWALWPWDGKLEGSHMWGKPFCTLGNEDLLKIPPFISRKFIKMDDFIWRIIATPVRTAKRLLHQDGKDEDMYIELLRSFANSNAHLIWWHEAGMAKVLMFDALALWIPEEWRLIVKDATTIYAGRFRAAVLWGTPCK
jgi:hypothetical protein